MLLALRFASIAHYNGLGQLCPTQMAYWAKVYVTIFIRAAHWTTY